MSDNPVEELQNLILSVAFLQLEAENAEMRALLRCVVESHQESGFVQLEAEEYVRILRVLGMEVSNGE